MCALRIHLMGEGRPVESSSICAEAAPYYQVSFRSSVQARLLHGIVLGCSCKVEIGL